MKTVKEIGKIFEIRCPCGKHFVVEAIERICSDPYIEKEELPSKISDIAYSTVTCPKCKINSFSFLYRYLIIRNEHPLHRMALKNCQKELAKYSEWSK